MVTRCSIAWGKRLGVALLLLLSLPALLAATQFPGVGTGIPGEGAGVWAQQPPPEVKTEDGWMTNDYRFEFDGLPFIFSLQHTDTGDGSQTMVGTLEQTHVWFALGFDYEKWAAQGNDEKTAPQHHAFVLVEDPTGHEFTVDGSTGFIVSIYSLGSGAHIHYDPPFSGEYSFTGSIDDPANVVVRTTMTVEITEPTAVPTAVPTVAEPTLAAPVIEPTEAPRERKPEREPPLDPWVSLLGGLLGGSGVLAYLLASGLLGPLPAGGLAPSQPRVETPEPADNYYEIMAELEESTRKASQMTEDLQKKVDQRRREHLKQDQAFYEDVAGIWEEAENIADWAVWGTDWLKWGCDRSIDFLAAWTAPAGGGKIKDAYTFATNFFQGLAKGDPLKGALKGAYDIGFGKICDGIHDRVKIPKKYGSGDPSSILPPDVASGKHFVLAGKQRGYFVYTVKPPSKLKGAGGAGLNAGVGFLEGKFIGKPIKDWVFGEGQKT